MFGNIRHKSIRDPRDICIKSTCGLQVSENHSPDNPVLNASAQKTQGQGASSMTGNDRTTTIQKERPLLCSTLLHGPLGRKPKSRLTLKDGIHSDLRDQGQARGCAPIRHNQSCKAAREGMVPVPP